MNREGLLASTSSSIFSANRFYGKIFLRNYGLAMTEYYYNSNGHLAAKNATESFFNRTIPKNPSNYSFKIIVPTTGPLILSNFGKSPILFDKQNILKFLETNQFYKRQETLNFFIKDFPIMITNTFQNTSQNFGDSFTDSWNF